MLATTLVSRRSSEPSPPRPKIVIHINCGADVRITRSVFNKIREYGVRYGVIGQSYYPWWPATFSI